MWKICNVFTGILIKLSTFLSCEQLGEYFQCLHRCLSLVNFPSAQLCKTFQCLNRCLDVVEIPFLVDNNVKLDSVATSFLILCIHSKLFRLFVAGIGSAWNIAQITPGSTVAVFGLGTIGLAVNS